MAPATEKAPRLRQQSGAISKMDPNERHIMNSTKATPNIDAMTVSELRAAGQATGKEPTETITLWDIDVAAAFGVEIKPVFDMNGRDLSHDAIEIELSDKPTYGHITVSRDAGDKEWGIAHEPAWNEYEPETLRSTVRDLSFAADLAEWLNKGTSK
jgi:hypothetical protein